MSISAMKQALDALEQLDGIDTETECVTIDVGDAITSLRQAIAEAEKQEVVTVPTLWGTIQYEQKQVKQEPVAWQVEVLFQGVWTPLGNPQRNKSSAEGLANNPSLSKDCQRIKELYIHPPQRQWLGLTPDEIMQLMDSYDVESMDYAYAIQDWLKEKNT